MSSFPGVDTNLVNAHIALDDRLSTMKGLILKPKSLERRELKAHTLDTIQDLLFEAKQDLAKTMQSEAEPGRSLFKLIHETYPKDATAFSSITKELFEATIKPVLEFINYLIQSAPEKRLEQCTIIPLFKNFFAEVFSANNKPRETRGILSTLSTLFEAQARHTVRGGMTPESLATGLFTERPQIRLKAK